MWHNHSWLGLGYSTIPPCSLLRTSASTSLNGNQFLYSIAHWWSRMGVLSSMLKRSSGRSLFSLFPCLNQKRKGTSQSFCNDKTKKLRYEENFTHSYRYQSDKTCDILPQSPILYAICHKVHDYKFFLDNGFIFCLLLEKDWRKNWRRSKLSLTCYLNTSNILSWRFPTNDCARRPAPATQRPPPGACPLQPKFATAFKALILGLYYLRK